MSDTIWPRHADRPRGGPPLACPFFGPGTLSALATTNSEPLPCPSHGGTVTIAWCRVSVADFASYDKTYGTMAGVIVLLV
jgi:D-hexose-6-phosphate mutarotase